MKNKFLNTSISALILSVCCLVNVATAGIIEYNGFNRDESNNYITGGGNDWLMWNATSNMSVSQALAANTGWHLATIDDMTGLFSAFAFNRVTSWKSNTSTGAAWAPGFDNGFEDFVNMFGITFSNAATYNYGDPSVTSSAIFGLDENGSYYSANVGTDSKFGYRGRNVIWDASARLSKSDTWTDSSINSHVGIALVRNTQKTDKNKVQVSEPSTLVIFALGMMALVTRRFKKQA